MDVAAQAIRTYCFFACATMRMGAQVACLGTAWGANARTLCKPYVHVARAHAPSRAANVYCVCERMYTVYATRVACAVPRRCPRPPSFAQSSPHTCRGQSHRVPRQAPSTPGNPTPLSAQCGLERKIFPLFLPSPDVGLPNKDTPCSHSPCTTPNCRFPPQTACGTPI
jgi:hypothetical protein